MVRELLTPDDVQIPRLCVIVGHTEKSQGAALHGGGSEYHYNMQVANLMKQNEASVGCLVTVVTRDHIGITGAYAMALRQHPDAVIELHFNAFNGKVRGSETLCSTDMADKKFAMVMHRHTCQAMRRDGQSRGVKPLLRSARGGVNVYAAPGVPSCLIEPFFGDNPEDAKLGVECGEAYAQALLEGFAEWAHFRLDAASLV